GGEEAAAVVHYNGDLADLLHVVECAGQGVIGGFLAHDDFHQLHFVHRGEEVQADEVIRLGGGLCQLGNGNGGGVGGKDAVGRHFRFRFLGNPGFQVAVFKHRLNNQVATFERSEEHTLNSSHVKISYAVFCLKKNKRSYISYRQH